VLNERLSDIARHGVARKGGKIRAGMGAAITIGSVCAVALAIEELYHRVKDSGISSLFTTKDA